MVALRKKNAFNMSDTRRANAAYQLDVDGMIFDYLLYHAIKSQLELLTVESGNGHVDPEHELINTAERLLTTFSGNKSLLLLTKQSRHCSSADTTSTSQYSEIFSVSTIQWMI